MKKFMSLLGLLPGILQTVIAVENSGAFPPGSGVRKHQLVLNAVSVAASAVPEVVGEFQRHEIEAATSSMITTSVLSLNAAGVFNRSISGETVSSKAGQASKEAQAFSRG